MKFGKNLLQLVESSDPEWGPYWIDYKSMKKLIHEITTSQGETQISDSPKQISQSAAEVRFFRALKSELRKATYFFASEEEICKARHLRVSNSLTLLRDTYKKYDENSCNRLLMACVKFYKDQVLLEKFAIMNYCGVSKILKKHDKSSGFRTRDAFMRNVMSHHNLTRYPYISDLLKQSEKLINDVLQMSR
jgi:SPX domain protein involved in polyphosphate accumulation